MYIKFFDKISQVNQKINFRSVYIKKLLIKTLKNRIFLLFFFMIKLVNNRKMSLYLDDNEI